MIRRIWSDEFGGKKKYKVIHVNEQSGEALLEETDTLGTTAKKVVASALWLGLLAALLSSTSKK